MKDSCLTCEDRNIYKLNVENQPRSLIFYMITFLECPDGVGFENMHCSDTRFLWSFDDKSH